MRSTVALVNTAMVEHLQLHRRLARHGYDTMLFHDATELLRDVETRARFDLLLLASISLGAWSRLSAVYLVHHIPTLLLAGTMDWLTPSVRNQFQSSPLMDYSFLTTCDTELAIRVEALLQRARSGCMSKGALLVGSALGPLDAASLW